MPPKRYNALPNAVRLFRCDLCAKDYSRQPDYEAHLRSYDHTHRTRMADMKKLTAANEEQAGRAKKKGPDDMRVVGTGKGGGFTKIGGGEMGGRFKKVGTAVGHDAKPGFTKIGGQSSVEEPKSEDKNIIEEAKVGVNVNEDVVMGDTDEPVQFNEYDFTKPTGCVHAVCDGCKLPNGYTMA